MRPARSCGPTAGGSCVADEGKPGVFVDRHYAQSRGLDTEAAVGLIVNGFCREVLQQLPMEFAVEAQKLLGLSLEGSVG